MVSTSLKKKSASCWIIRAGFLVNTVGTNLRHPSTDWRTNQTAGLCCSISWQDFVPQLPTGAWAAKRFTAYSFEERSTAASVVSTLF